MAYPPPPKMTLDHSGSGAQTHILSPFEAVSGHFEAPFDPPNPLEIPDFGIKRGLQKGQKCGFLQVIRATPGCSNTCFGSFWTQKKVKTASGKTLQHAKTHMPSSARSQSKILGRVHDSFVMACRYLLFHNFLGSLRGAHQAPCAPPGRHTRRSTTPPSSHCVCS